MFTQTAHKAEKEGFRGKVFTLLTTRLKPRRSLDWERTQIDQLLANKFEFTCPWSGKIIKKDIAYDLDHIIPVSIYPYNELWNLVPSDPEFNQRKKRDRLPNEKRLSIAENRLATTYNMYYQSNELRKAIIEDIHYRFNQKIDEEFFGSQLSRIVLNFIRIISDVRNVARF